jgi:hypothetical protein
MKNIGIVDTCWLTVSVDMKEQLFGWNTFPGFHGREGTKIAKRCGKGLTMKF